jgi:hypothetical protein
VSHTKIMLAVPTYNGSIDYRHARSYRAFYEMGRASLYAALSNLVAADAGMVDKAQAVRDATNALQRDPVDVVHWQVNSALCYGFNGLYQSALRRRGTNGVTHFLMLHADVGVETPAVPWPEKMLAIMEREKLGVLSVTVPLKTPGGETSAAIDAHDDQPLRRLTIGDTAMRTVTTRQEPGLLINTGCMMIDLRQPWADDVCFQTRDYIENGEPVFHPEDWEFSRWLRERGVAFGTTGEVMAVHVGGRTEYRNM